MSQQPLEPFNPDYAISPGEILVETLEARGIEEADFAQRCNLPMKTMGEILSGKTPLQPELAIQFEQILGVSASVWMNLEKAYRKTKTNPSPSCRSTRPLIRGAAVD